MRIVYIGTVEFSERVLRKLISLKADVVGVLTKEASSFNSDFVDLSEICRDHDIPCKYIRHINSSDCVEWIEKLKPDIIFCFGISQIIKEDILSIPRMGVLGFHPAKLPQNRGRHPIIWALVLGLKETASTFFFMTDGVDDGDIISQVDVAISDLDTARSLYDKITETALLQIETFLPQLQSGNYLTSTQAHGKSNLWRKRGVQDGKIDFRMNSRSICNLIRGLTKPYVGAHLIYREREIKVWEADAVEFAQDNIEQGKVLDVKDKGVLVKCGDDAVLLTKCDFESVPAVGEYL